MSSSKVFNMDESNERPCLQIWDINPKFDVYAIDLNGIARRINVGDAILDGEAIRAVAKENLSSDVEVAYTVSKRVNCQRQDVIGIVFTSPVRYWRKDRFYVKGSLSNPKVYHVLVSQS